MKRETVVLVALLAVATACSRQEAKKTKQEVEKTATTVAEKVEDAIDVAVPIGKDDHQETLDQLDVFGGFPEPFMKQSKRHLRRWHNEKIERMLREDILDVQVNAEFLRLRQ